MRSRASFCLIGIFITFLTLCGMAHAGMILDAEVRIVYEDNVVGLLTDRGGGVSGPGYGTMAAALNHGGGPASTPSYTGSSSVSQGDFSYIFFAAIGADKRYDNALMFLKVSAEQAVYSTFDEFNSSIMALSLGAFRSFSDLLSGQITLFVRDKFFGEPLRDSTSYGGSFFLKQQFSRSFWLKEWYEYEKNQAEDPAFSYSGDAAGMSAGYAVSDTLAATAGYSYMAREFEDPAGFIVTSHSLSAGIEKKFLDSWYIFLSYERQMSDSDAPDSYAVDNIYAMGLRYSY